MKSVGYADFRRAVCKSRGCWQTGPLTEAGVTADLGAGWRYFLTERHYGSAQCVGRANTSGRICDALAVPNQANRRRLVFLELKSSGQYAAAIKQIRRAAERVVAEGLPSGIALSAEIWCARDPKTTIVGQRRIRVAGRDILVRHKRSR